MYIKVQDKLVSNWKILFLKIFYSLGLTIISELKFYLTKEKKSMIKFMKGTYHINVD